MEDALIVAIVFGFALAVVKMTLDYLKEKGRRSSNSSAESSLTTSELRLLVQQAVEDAIDARFGKLEERLDKFSEPRLIPAGQREETELETPPSPPVASDRESTR